MRTFPSIFKVRISGLAMSALLLSACGGVDKYDFASETKEAQVDLPTVGSKDGSDEFRPAAAGGVKVDMLFVVDNSGSMKEEQQILADSFSQFIAQFIQKNIDFHIGVVTTDVSNESSSTYWGQKLAGYHNPAMGCLLTRSSGEPYLASNTSNLEAKFRDNVRVGTAGSGSEQGLHSMQHALKASRLAPGGCNEGFLRDDSLLWVGVVSDENEDIKDGKTPSDRVSDTMSVLSGLRGKGSRGWKSDFIIDLQAKKPSSPITYPLPSNATNSYPEIYLLAADMMKSRKLDIMQNFSSGLVSVGSDIIRAAEREFKLTHSPIPGTLKVMVNGSLIKESASNGYIMHWSRNVIELTGSAATSSAGGKVVAEYKYL